MDELPMVSTRSCTLANREHEMDGWGFAGRDVDLADRSADLCRLVRCICHARYTTDIHTAFWSLGSNRLDLVGHFRHAFIVSGFLSGVSGASGEIWSVLTCTAFTYPIRSITRSHSPSSCFPPFLDAFSSSFVSSPDPLSAARSKVHSSVALLRSLWVSQPGECSVLAIGGMLDEGHWQYHAEGFWLITRNVDNIFCNFLRDTREKMGPFGFLLQGEPCGIPMYCEIGYSLTHTGHGYWHLLTTYGSFLIFSASGRKSTLPPAPPCILLR